VSLLAIRRLLAILRVVIRYRLDDLLFAARLPWWLAVLRFVLPWRLLPRKHYPRGEALKLALQDLGPIFIKFGQMLSTRRDLLAPDIAAELCFLQDKVPPFDPAQAQSMIEAQFGDSVENLFAWFEAAPLASASIAQVHAARLTNGDEVIIKVIRPNLEAVIHADIAWLFALGRFAERLSSEARRLHLVDVVSDYEKIIFDELDLLREAANASQFRRNFANSPKLYVPRVYWPLCRARVLVMERINGIPVTDLAALKAQNTDFRRLAESGVELFFTQLFRDNFFHADMHPGNIFVSRAHPQNPQYIAIDFGIVGSLSTEDKDYLAHNLMAFFNRDYRKVAQLHIDSGWVAAGTRVEDFEAAVRTVCEPIFELPLKDISFGHLLLRLFQIARRFDMEVQPQLVLLQKTLLNIEGLGRQLYPELNLWETAKPFIERWMRERVSPKQIFNHLKSQLEQLPQLVRSTQMAMERLAEPSPAPPNSHRLERGIGAALLVVTALQQTSSIMPDSSSTLLLPALLGAVGLYLILRR